MEHLHRFIHVQLDDTHVICMLGGIVVIQVIVAWLRATTNVICNKSSIQQTIHRKYVILIYSNVLLNTQI